MRPKLRNSIIAGVLIIASGLLLFGPFNLLKSSTSETEDCGPTIQFRFGYDDLICESGKPNTNAEKDSNLLTNFKEIMTLKPSASAADIEKAICYYDMQDEAIRNTVMDVYSYKYVLNRWEKKQKSTDSILNLILDNDYCTGGSNNGKNYDAANMTMEERYRGCIDLKNRMRDTYAEILQSLLRDDNELWAWFALTNSIKESRRDYLSQDSESLIYEYRDFFNTYQILQCELNFPVLKERKLQSNDQQTEPWTPSAIV